MTETFKVEEWRILVQGWAKFNFSRQYQYFVKQTGDENIKNYQLGILSWRHVNRLYFVIFSELWSFSLSCFVLCVFLKKTQNPEINNTTSVLPYIKWKALLSKTKVSCGSFSKTDESFYAIDKKQTGCLLKSLLSELRRDPC